jgi:RNA polymerase sigma factor (sigma-70 family)
MEWTSQAVRGSAAAFAGVYERHHRALYRYCCALLGDEEEARDALQSTMTKAFAALRFEERDFELRPWLFRIAHNEAVSRLRQRRDAVGIDVAHTLATDSLAQTVEDRERIAQLRADLRELPERQRAALLLRELSGLGHAEIAAVLGGSPATVKQTIFAARTALNECAEGRAMLCTEVQRMLSGGDGRVLRSRRMRAHVRACRSCREFQAALDGRPMDLAALAPVPAACATWLSRLLVSGGESGAGAVATKVAAVVAATAALAGATTAVREVTRETGRPAASAHASASAPSDRVALARASTALPTALVAPGSRERTRPRLATGAVHHRPSLAAATTVTVKAANIPASPSSSAPSDAAPTKSVADQEPPAGRGPAAQQPPAAASKPAARAWRAPTKGAPPPRERRARADRPAEPGGQGAAKPDAPGHATPPAAAPASPPGVAQTPAATGPPDDPGASGRAHNQK